MLRIQATIKAPESAAPGLERELAALGVDQISQRRMPYQVFAEESRLNYDCVYPEAWEEKKEVVYLTFSFADSGQGREAAYRVEYGLKQIPLNLCYVDL